VPSNDLIDVATPWLGASIYPVIATELIGGKGFVDG